MYQEIDQRLDSLKNNYEKPAADSLMVGFSRVSITPAEVTPLAGYSGRDPMEYTEILDSVFVRTVVLKSGESQVAMISAELLIIHPLIVKAVEEKAAELGWKKSELFFNATHSHSSLGGWSPGFAGEWVAGDYNPNTAEKIIDAMFASLEMASQKPEAAAFSYANSELGVHVKNRLVKDEGEDSWVRNMFFRTGPAQVVLSAFSAHATCFDAHSNLLTGDYPSYFHNELKWDSSGYFPMYLAGAVGSMGPDGPGNGNDRAIAIGEGLANQVRDLNLLGLPFESEVELQSFNIRVPLRAPQLKISRNLKLRPWVFKQLVGEYPIEFSVVRIGNVLLVGTPCDFSGEVALPLYEYAREKGLNLIITSFNGGYIGYVTRDDRYDLEKYETRSMNWYGPDIGAYFSEIIRRIIDTVAE